jgi:hypothetical protein
VSTQIAPASDSTMSAIALGAAAISSPKLESVRRSYAKLSTSSLTRSPPFRSLQGAGGQVCHSYSKVENGTWQPESQQNDQPVHRYKDTFLEEKYDYFCEGWLLSPALLNYGAVPITYR